MQEYILVEKNKKENYDKEDENAEEALLRQVFLALQCNEMNWMSKL